MCFIFIQCTNWNDSTIYWNQKKINVICQIRLITFRLLINYHSILKKLYLDNNIVLHLPLLEASASSRMLPLGDCTLFDVFPLDGGCCWSLIGNGAGASKVRSLPSSSSALLGGLTGGGDSSPINSTFTTTQVFANNSIRHSLNYIFSNNLKQWKMQF